VKRWPVEFDGVAAGAVYADGVEDARRAAQAAYKRVYPERDPAQARVRVGAPGEVASVAGEARQLVNEVYEGLRLLPGMELPAEKLRGAVVLLETVAARAGLAPLGAAAGGDNELRDALEPVIAARTVPELVRERLKGLVEWVGVNTAEAERRRIELEAFRALWEVGLLDPRLAEGPGCDLYRASAYLTRRLVKAGALKLERFDAATSMDDLRAALRGVPKEAWSMLWAFAPTSEEPAQVTALRPMAHVGERLLQPALLVRGVPAPDDEVLAFDTALFDVQLRLRTWTDGLGRLAEAGLDDKQRQLIPRTEKRVEETRAKMAQAVQEKTTVLPTEVTRRDLMKFVIDQVHRAADALAFLADRSLRDAFAELVFKDVVFRGAGAYLSDHHGIAIDTDVVEGADAQSLTGRYKNEAGGPKPRAKTTRIHSVVLPCYTQGGVAVRPAAIRVGDY
jgi:hypothetical protein